MSYSRESLERALMQADAAGDYEGAQIIADELKKLAQVSEQSLDPSEGMNVAEKALVGVGRSMSKTIGGVASMLGIGNDAQRQENSAVYNRNATPAMRVGEFAGDIGQFAVPGGAVGKVTAARGLVPRMLAQGGTAAAVDATQQLGESGNVETGRAALAAAAGGAGELLAPFFARGANAVGRVLSGKNRMEAGAQIVRAGGGNPGEYTRGQLIDLAERASEIARNAPGVAEEMAKFGTQVTRGQAIGMGSAEGNAFLRAEQSARNLRPELFKPIDDANEQALRTSIQRLAQSGGSQAENVFDAAAAVKSGLSDARNAAKRAASDAYDKVGGAVFDSSAADSLLPSIEQALKASNVRLSNPARTSATREALEIISEATQKAEGATGFKLDAVNDVRQQLNDLYSRNMHPSDKRALTIVKQEFDNWRDSLPNSIIRGSDTAVDDLKAANAQYADLQSKFNAREGGGKVVRDLLENPFLEAPEEVAKKVIGVSGKGVQSTNAAIAAIKNAAPQTAADLKAMVFYGMTDGLKDPNTRGVVLRGLRDSVAGRQTTLQQLYTPDELNEINQFIQAFDRLQPKGVYARDSGTPGGLQRIFMQFPIARQLLEYAAERYTINTAMGGINPVRAGAFAGATAVAPGALAVDQ